MVIQISTAFEGAGGAVTALSGIYAIVRKVISNSKNKKKAYREALLLEAKQEAEKIIRELSEKIEKLENEFELQKFNISKDLEHFRETYNNELRVLGEKIENLRKDLSDQHQGLVALLTKLVDK